MTAKELAKKLNGTDIMDFPGEHDREDAKKSQLVIVYVDEYFLLQIIGAIQDEVDWSTEDAVHISKSQKKLVRNSSGLNPDIATIKPRHDDKEFFYYFETEIPNHTFKFIKDESTYCQGIVFSLDDLEGKKAKSKSYQCRVIEDGKGKMVILKGQKYPRPRNGRYNDGRQEIGGRVRGVEVPRFPILSNLYRGAGRKGRDGGGSPPVPLFIGG